MILFNPKDDPENGKKIKLCTYQIHYYDDYSIFDNERCTRICHGECKGEEAGCCKNCLDFFDGHYC